MPHFRNSFEASINLGKSMARRTDLDPGSIISNVITIKLVKELAIIDSLLFLNGQRGCDEHFIQLNFRVLIPISQ